MAFEYRTFVNPYAPGISDAILRSGDIEARRAEAVAAAQAHATEASAAAWGGATQSIGQTIAGTIAQQTDPRRKLEQQQVDANTRGQQFTSSVNHIVSTLTQQNPDGTRTLDRGKLQQAFSAANIPPPMQEQTFKALDDVDASISRFNTARTDHLADLAHAVIKAGATPEAMAMGTALAKANGLVTDDQLAPITQAIATGQPLLPMLQSIRGLSEKYKDAGKPIAAPEGTTFFNPDTQQPIPGMAGTPKPPTESELAVRAAQGDPVAVAAMNRLKPPPNPDKLSLEEQLLKAKTSGDTETEKTILATIRAKAEASKDPGAVAMANQLAGLRADDLRARLDAAKKKAEPLDVTPDIQTTIAGRSYIDLSKYTGEERNKAHAAANAAGAIPVSKEEADALQNIDTARANQGDILNQIKDALPKGPAGRVLLAPVTTLEKVFQTDDQKAAFATWRTAAIQTMRATAGSKGLRINRSEIEQAIENDIPKLTDTLGTAQQKVKNITTMLENAEKSILVRDRRAPQADFGPATPPTLPPFLQNLGKR